MKTWTALFFVVGIMILSFAKKSNVEAMQLKSDTTIRMTNHNNIKVVLDKPMTAAQLNIWKKDSMYFTQGPFVFRVIGDTAWKQ